MVDAIETAKTFLNTVDHIVTATERYEKALGDTVTQIERTGSSGFSRDEVVSHAERIARERSLTEIEVLQGIQFGATFQSLDEDEIIRVIELANDRAESGGGDFLSNIGILANALQNFDTSGLGLLERDRTDILNAARVDPDEAQKLILDALRRNIAETGVLDRDNLIDLRHLAGVELESAERAIGGTGIGRLTRDAAEKYEEFIEGLSRVVTDKFDSPIDEDLLSDREFFSRQVAILSDRLERGGGGVNYRKNVAEALEDFSSKVKRIDDGISLARQEKAAREAAIDERSRLIQEANNQTGGLFADAMGEPVFPTQLFDPESLDAFGDALTKAFRDVGEEICACLREDKETEFAERVSPTSVAFLRGPEEQFRRQLLVADAMPETGLSGGGTFVAEDFGRAGREGFEEIREAARLASRTVVDAFQDWIKGSLDAEDALKSFARQLSEIGLQKFVLNPLEKVLDTGADALITAIFGSSPKLSKRAFGGPVTAGDPFLVGERGPELFVPHWNGTIIADPVPAGGMSVGSITVNVTGGINNQGRQTPGQVAAQIAAELARQQRRNG